MRRIVALAIVAVALLVACGGGGGGGNGAEGSPPPERVPDGVVPEELAGLGIFENRDESTLEVLANTDDSTLVSDTRVWELRRGDFLAGTLQISTVLPRVDLLDEDVRDRFASQVILGQFSRIRVGDTEVFTTSSNDKTVFLWFGSTMFQVMQTKDSRVDPEAVLRELVAFQDASEQWVPLPQLLDFDDV